MTNTVLTVDDDAGIRALLKFRLEKNGFAVTACKNGRECLDYLREESLPVAVLLDVRMPGVDGMEVLETVHTEFEGLPVVVLSGAQPPTETTDAPAVAAHIEKPFRMDEVVTCLEGVLDT